jgi:hypothetical protein
MADSVSEGTTFNLMLTLLQLERIIKGGIDIFYYPQQKCQPAQKDLKHTCVRDIKSPNLII